MEYFNRIQQNEQSTFLITNDSVSKTYGEILSHACHIAKNLKELIGERKHIALLSSQQNYVICQWGIWLSGNACIPLSTLHTVNEWKYIISDSDSVLVLAEKRFEHKLMEIQAEVPFSLSIIETLLEYPLIYDKQPILIDDSRKALILYTSGTTGKPKGVIWDFRNLMGQIKSMVEEWCWQSSDNAVNVLPLHHFHGIVNVLLCSSWIGATLLLVEKYDSQFWKICRLHNISVLMAVPTIYAKLLAEFELLDDKQKLEFKEAFNRMRLIVSGSASLPIPIFNKWRIVTGHALLERYGMTEVGMVLTNPYNGPRIAGSVGKAFPHVDLKLVDPSFDDNDNCWVGQLAVKRRNIFLGYWKRDAEESFSNQWFLTGDIIAYCSRSDSDGTYKVLGRLSQDIIKSSGYKISALEIENVILAHENVEEVAVVGLQDETWGEVVAAAVVLKIASSLTKEQLLAICTSQIARYKCPRVIHFFGSLPRNAVGKIIKSEVKSMIEAKNKTRF